MSEKTLQFNDIILNKKKFHKSKESIDLLSVDADQIVASHKFKLADDVFKYFIGYKEGEIVKPFCIILPQMSGYIKYFENGNKNMTFSIKDDEVWDKYDKIWYAIKDKLGIKFHSKHAYDGVIETIFLCNDMPKENIYYTCIAYITIDSVSRIYKKNPSTSLFRRV